jgi:hypothetical protein
VESALEVFSFVASSLELLVSFDCLAIMSGVRDVGEQETFYGKVVAYGFAPIIFSALAALILFIKYLRKNKDKRKQYKLNRRIYVTACIITYFLYPTIVNLTFSLFNCTRVEGTTDFYLRRDFTIKCWTSSHVIKAIMIGLPMMAVWVFGFPLFIFWKLFKSRKALDETEVVFSHGLFFAGLSDHAYFWEIIVSNARKVIFIICGSLLSPVNVTFKVGKTGPYSCSWF